MQRLFGEWPGITPKRFVHYLTKEPAKKALRESARRAAQRWANPVEVLIPCQRVIRDGRAVGEYRWGATCMQVLLVLEGLAWE